MSEEAKMTPKGSSPALAEEDLLAPLLKQLVNEAIKYNQQRSRLLAQLIIMPRKRKTREHSPRTNRESCAPVLCLEKYAKINLFLRVSEKEGQQSS